jgi:molybdopterin molybdotransferase
LISTGDEIIEPSQSPRPGQVRDINSYTLAALIEKNGGVAKRYGIIRDQLDLLKDAAAQALSECDVVIITAGSSASTRDMTADVIRALGEPGVLVNGYLFVVPVIEKLLGALTKPKATIHAKLTVNLPSQTGREDWWPVQLVVNRQSSIATWDAVPIFGKSNLIFTLANADGLLRISPDATGVNAGETVEVMLI